MRLSTARRAGFTLIELLVTMALIIVLLSIAVAVSNSAAVDSYKLVGSADKVAQALLTSKSRALRDKAPRGIRFNIEPGTNFVREIVYIESGEPWLPDQTETLEQSGANAVAINPNRSQFVIRYQVTPGAVGSAGPFPKPQSTDCRAYLLLNNNANVNRTNGTQRGDSDYQRFLREVQVGDVIYSPDLGAAVTITSTATAGTLDTAAGVPAGFVVLEVNASGMTNPDMAAGFSNLSDANVNVRNRGTFQTTQFGIYRSPRPIAGEPTLILSRNVAIDTAASLGVNPGVSFDVLFAPSGQIMNMSDGIVALTVRDTFKYTAPAGNWLTADVGGANFKLAGEMVLVALYPKTGTVATKPVNAKMVATDDPYQFVKDAINSGF